MDPNQWRNYNQAYGHISHSSGLSPTGASLNRFDLSLLNADQALGSGLGISPSLQSSSMSSARSMGALGAANYPHALHNTMAPFLDAVNTLPSGFPTQSPYKSLGQSSFGIEASPLRSPDPSSLYGLSSAVEARSHAKSFYAQDSILSKEPQLSYGLASSVSPLSSMEKSSKASGWSLSNFVTSPTSPFGNLSETALSELAGPPPAHSGNTATSRHSTIQRNPFPPDLFSHAPLTSKSRSYSMERDDLLLASPTLQLPRGGPPDTIFSSPAHHGIENLTKSSGHHNSIFGFPPNSSVLKSELASTYQQQLSSDINYDPVSPPTPLSDAGQPPQSETFTNVGLHDISPMGHIQHGSMSRKSEDRLVQDPHHVILHPHLGKSGSMQNIPVELNNTPIQMSNSPMQQSPISVGGSPHMSVPMSSPKTPMSSSSLVQAKPPIQALADSTTKPKRVRGRKKKVPSAEHDNTAKFSPEGMTSQHMINTHGDLIGMGASISSPGHMMSMGSSAFSQSNPYSPQKSQPYSPHTHQQYNSSPKKSQSVSPQSYSPQVASQVMMDKAYNNHQQSPVMEDQFSMQHSANMSSQNPMTLPPSTNHLSMMSDSVIRSSGHSSVIHNLAGERIRPSHQPQCATPSPPERQACMPVNSMSMSDLSSTPLADAMVASNNNYDYNSVPPLFVEQLHSDSNMDHLNKSSMDDPMALGQLDLQGQQGPYVSPQQPTGYMSSQPAGYVSQPPNSIYTDLDSYNNQYENAHGNLTSPPMGFGNSPHPNNTSTIDEDALSNLIGNPSMGNVSPMKEPSPDYWRARVTDEPKLQSTVTSRLEFDDDFVHLTKPPVSEKKETKQNVKMLSNSVSATNASMPNTNLTTTIPAQPKPEQNVPVKKPKSSSFMDSYLSFIQGKKPETLSSLHIGNVKKPELPKYIPEPRRPRPVESSDSAASTPRPDTDNKSEFSSNTGHNSPNDDTANSRLTTSDDDDDGANVRGKVENVPSDVTDDGVKKDSLKMRISFSKITGGVKMKNSKTRVRVLSGSQKGKTPSIRFSARDTVASSGDDDDYVISSSEEEAALREDREPTPPPPEPMRQVSSRRAKDKGRKVYKDSSDSDASIDFPEPITKDRDSDVDYDSDKDPAWTPFAVDNKRQPTYEALDYRGGPKKGRQKGMRKVRKTSFGTKRIGEKLPPSQPLKIQKVSEPGAVAEVDDKTGDTSPEEDKNYVSDSNNIEEEATPSKGYQAGDYLLDKKDLTNYENFPIWRIESGKLIRKFELITEDGEMRHRSMCTFSSWLPTMHKDYVPIKTKSVSSDRDKEVVEVFEMDRPTPKLDSYLEHAYEEDPLADLFNVYLQIFLSQALEPGFLSAIGEGEENFYMGPLQSIDKIIEKKLEEIELRVQWKSTFKSALRGKPHIRELDRPHLKQSCQACENASQPAIKSIHLFGQSYDKFSLEEHAGLGTEAGSTEFMIGKMAANYVRAYHSLYHFKYNLSKRCLAKVDIVRQSDSELDNSEVLDRCLNNRTWVLKIFDDLKTMLDKG